MPAPYSTDLRERVVAALAAGDRTRKEVAVLFKLGVATVGRWKARKKRTGSVEPTPQPQSPARRALDEHGDARLRALVEANPDATEEELTEFLQDDGHDVSRSSVHRALHRLDLTWKKKRLSRPSATRSG